MSHRSRCKSMLVAVTLVAGLASLAFADTPVGSVQASGCTIAGDVVYVTVSNATTGPAQATVAVRAVVGDTVVTKTVAVSLQPGQSTLASFFFAAAVESLAGVCVTPLGATIDDCNPF